MAAFDVARVLLSRSVCEDRSSLNIRIALEPARNDLHLGRSSRCDKAKLAPLGVYETVWCQTSRWCRSEHVAGQLPHTVKRRLAVSVRYSDGQRFEERQASVLGALKSDQSECDAGWRGGAAGLRVTAAPTPPLMRLTQEIHFSWPLPPVSCSRPTWTHWRSLGLRNESVSCRPPAHAVMETVFVGLTDGQRTVDEIKCRSPRHSLPLLRPQTHARRLPHARF
ncbi:hypothetical protein L1887_62175 [Cichorium endivia]|nr:hypothetical protein L1887_62175 [Cichorium endivia]